MMSDIPGSNVQVNYQKQENRIWSYTDWNNRPAVVYALYKDGSYNCGVVRIGRWKVKSWKINNENHNANID